MWTNSLLKIDAFSFQLCLLTRAMDTFFIMLNYKGTSSEQYAYAQTI
jgi:hypothetical protein